ncbi:hypothetical protein APSETT445_004032 [Aspergillus pseudonomiae]
MNLTDAEGQLKDISSHEIEHVNVIEAVSFTSEEEKALVRKIDLTLLPTIWIMYLLSYLDRTKVILGCVEAGFAPGVLLVLSSWYKQTEQSKRFGVFISAAVLSGAFGGLIAAGIVDGLEGVHGIRGWRWLFIIEGAATVGFAIISLFILPDFPATSRHFSEREKQVAVARLSTENVNTTTEDSEHLSSLDACKVACQNWRTWAFIIGYMVIVGSSTLTYFYPTLVEGLFGNASTKKVNLLTVPIYGVAFIATARYILLVFMAAGLWATNGGTLAYASSAFAGMHPQARGVALAMVNALGNLAQIYGSAWIGEIPDRKVSRAFQLDLDGVFAPSLCSAYATE